MAKRKYHSRLTWLESTKPELFNDERKITSTTSSLKEKEVSSINIAKYRNISDRGFRCILKACAFVLLVITIGGFYITGTDTSSDHPPSPLTAGKVSDNLIPKTFELWKQ